MTGQRRTQFRSRATEGRWPSLVVSLAVSVALFVAALVSMTSLPRWIRYERNASPDLPVFLRIPAPSPRPTPAPKNPERQSALKRSVDVTGMGVVAFDQIGIIAVHRTHKVSDRERHDRIDLTGE